MAAATASVLTENGYVVSSKNFFDTIVVDVSSRNQTSAQVQESAASNGVNIRVIDNNRVGISFGESITWEDVNALLWSFEVISGDFANVKTAEVIEPALQRKSAFLTHPVFNSYHSETKMLRYLKHL
jgi:glycine dehydrogenase